eukprot:TRINITY_DN7876_c0_g1_i1.p1 TRINITY_DN7876_c0_g1~~TRINITY_DN7876_c0_g1_i1.p1  ORF type:complete len:279 (+),score=93.98 TRINITY_DN7876_c0_g1_i1:162-998(+)
MEPAAPKRPNPRGLAPTTVKLVSLDKRIAKEFKLHNVTARDVEETFRLVRCHVEGTDHSVAFPNKQTGLYERLNGRATYSVYGHTYSATETWKPRPKVDRNAKLIVPRDETVIEGDLQRLHKGFFTKRWEHHYFTLKYNVLEMWRKKEDKKPKASMTIDRSIKVSTCDLGTQHPFAFMLNGDEETWYLSPASAARREEWMIWLQTISVFNAPASWKEGGAEIGEAPETVRLPALDDSDVPTLEALSSFDEGLPRDVEAQDNLLPGMATPPGRLSARHV